MIEHRVVIYFKTEKANCWVYLGGGFPGGSEGEESVCSAGDPGSIPGAGRSPGEGNGNPLQYSCLENSMDREAWRVQASQSPGGHKESGKTEQLSLHFILRRILTVIFFFF